MVARHYFLNEEVDTADEVVEVEVFFNSHQKCAETAGIHILYSEPQLL